MSTPRFPARTYVSVLVGAHRDLTGCVLSHEARPDGHFIYTVSVGVTGFTVRYLATDLAAAGDGLTTFPNQAAFDAEVTA